MPAFGSALSAEEIALVVGHLRTFCGEPQWPRGDLNFPRAFFTEKAFPENEAVWTTGFSQPDDGRELSTTLIYERRFGARNQVELAVPVDFISGAGTAVRGLGDVAIAFKRALYAEVRSGRIAAAGAEVILPTGNSSTGLGAGYTTVEPFAMWGQALPRSSFLQMHGGVELPSDTTRGSREVFVRTAIGTTFAQQRGVRPRLVAAGRAALGASAGRRQRMGSGAAAAGHALETPARHGGRRRAPAALRSERSPGAGRRLLPVGLVRRRSLRVLAMSWLRIALRTAIAGWVVTWGASRCAGRMNGRRSLTSRRPGPNRPCRCLPIQTTAWPATTT